MGADCKSVAKATQVRILYLPPLTSAGRRRCQLDDMMTPTAPTVTMTKTNRPCSRSPAGHSFGSWNPLALTEKLARRIAGLAR